MDALVLGPSYLYWHYARSWKSLWQLWKNFLSFIVRFFSFSLLLQTFFSPWKRMQEEKTKGLDLEVFFSRILVNSILRAVGICARTFVMLVGLIALILHVIVGIVAFAVWCVYPFLLVALFLRGVVLLFI